MRGIEKRSELMPNQQYDSTITVDRRFYGKRGSLKNQQRVRIAIFRKTSLAVELTPEDAIEFFRAGLNYAEELKSQQS